MHIRCASAPGVGHGNGEERVIDKWIARHVECVAAYVQVADGLAAIGGQVGAGEHAVGAGDQCLYTSG